MSLKTSSSTLSVASWGWWSSPPPERPPEILEALRENRPIYYFGLGSHMLRSELETPGNKEPAIVKKYRLGFNLRAFPPLEPCMASLEPVDDPQRMASRPLTPLYGGSSPECHGALILLRPDDYERLMRSRGVIPNLTADAQKNGDLLLPIETRVSPTAFYQEIVVTAIPYDSTKPPVQAMALQVVPRSQLRYDACPSPRYMEFLRQDAAELSLTPEYQDWLAHHPVQQTPAWLCHLARYHCIWFFTLDSWGLRRLTRPFNHVLYAVMVPTQEGVPLWKQSLSRTVTALLLWPNAVLGWTLDRIRQVTGAEHPLLVRDMLTMIQSTANPDDAVTAPPPSSTTHGSKSGLNPVRSVLNMIRSTATPDDSTTAPRSSSTPQGRDSGPHLVRHVWNMIPFHGHSKASPDDTTTSPSTHQSTDLRPPLVRNVMNMIPFQGRAKATPDDTTTVHPSSSTPGSESRPPLVRNVMNMIPFQGRAKATPDDSTTVPPSSSTPGSDSRPPL